MFMPRNQDAKFHLMKFPSIFDSVRFSDDAQWNKPATCTTIQVLPLSSLDPSDLGQQSLATFDCKLSRSEQRFSLSFDMVSFFDCASTDGKYNLVLPQTMSPNPMKTAYRNLQRTKFRPFRGTFPHPRHSPMPIFSLRRDFESPITHIPGNGHDGNDQDEDDSDDDFEGDPNEPTSPAYFPDLVHRLARSGYDPEDEDFEVPVRTWYIDHATVHRWTAPRTLQLIGPPRGWTSQFTSLWIDQLDPDEWFDLTIIDPDPPRSRTQRHVVLDIVITQSLHLPRLAGLVTVTPGIHENIDIFSVACSFAERISGYDILQISDTAALCMHRTCQITHRWDEIPNTLRPTHGMGHGDGFQVLLLGRSGPEVNRNRQHPATNRPGSSNNQSGYATGQSPAAASSSSGQPDGQPSRQSLRRQSNRQHASFMTTLHVFQLHGPEVIVQLVNAQAVLPTHELAHALNVPFECLEAIHTIPCRPVDFPEMSIPAIVQRTGDVPLRTTDRLIMVDIIYQNHPTANNEPVPPTVVRTVQRVGYHVIRQTLLFVAGVYHYCEFFPRLVSTVA